MKKFFQSLFAVVLMAMTLASCEDVPAPFDLNGPGGSDDPDVPVVVTEPAGSGTVEDPYNVARVLQMINEGTFEEGKKVYFKGIVTDLSSNSKAKGYGIDPSYGNATFEIGDTPNDATTFLVYRCYGLNGDRFTTGDEFAVGDTLVVYAELMMYNTTPETRQGGQLYSINGKTSGNTGGGDTPGNAEGDGTANSPYNVSAAVAAGAGTGVYVKGYIVGYVSGQVLSEGAKFSADNCDVKTNLLLAASATETNYANCMPIQLPAGDVRTGLNLQDNAANLGKEVTLYGNIEKYFGATGMKSVTYAVLNGNKIGTDPAGTGGDTPSTGNDLLNETFASSQGNFTIDNLTTLPEGISYVWAHDTRYGMKASAYVSGTNYATQSRLVSPAIDLSKVSSATLTFEHAARYFADAAAELKLQVTTDGTTWTDVTIPTYPDGTNWNYVTATVDLSAYAGKSGVKIGFLYTSTDSKAATWEIKNVVIK